jgi:hypothetical protein
MRCADLTLQRGSPPSAEGFAIPNSGWTGQTNIIE